MGKIDFLSIADFGREELDLILDLAATLKEAWRAGRSEPRLSGKTLALIFHKPSLRTRVSFEVGVGQLGGRGLYITDAEIGFGKRESVHDIAQVLSRYVDGIMIRTFRQSDVAEMAKHASVPVINGLTDAEHPCQILSDLFTLREKGVALDGMRIAWIGDGNNVAKSWIDATLAYEIELRLACPEGYHPDEKAVEQARTSGKGKVEIFDRPEEAIKGARAIYVDTWTSMGQEEEAELRRRAFAGYTLDRRLLGLAGEDALVLHCLPAHRGEEITDEVMDGPQSVVFDQAENRMHLQKGILVHCMAAGGGRP
ncbi:MAG: ornithine carbamoyltransferase [Candidatus Eisenbacteria bacterium]|nr:ornithine carbamoyltransferase [Candidatus Latescibacterota bacterium]MBD3301828.1 ornithine carbamoyltransferase [Candidatus Eisenbacteria bacterium]